MVKADIKRDYYADLELPLTADEDQIKRQFRLLAKQYHPDRNPGHEVEFVSKFQAVQAAHEILSDPAEKARYDVSRAKQQRTTAPPPPRDDPYGFRKPARAQTTTFPPPPPPQNKPKSTPKPAYATPKQGPAPSAGAEKWQAFTRGAQTWDRARFEEAARAEGARGFQRMPAPGIPPQMAPRPPRQHPTAPRPPSNPLSQDLPNGGNPGFPGMSRTNSARRMHYPDEPPAGRSAYAYVRADRPPPNTSNPQSPPMPRAQAPKSPLRHVRSTEHTKRPDRPPMYERQTNRYSATLGERTDINAGADLGRSASVRASPVDRAFDDRDSGPFGQRPHSHHYAQSQPAPRHRSASPKMRQSSFTSSEGSDDPVRMRDDPNDRPRAAPKSRRTQGNGLDSPFPNTNYTRVVDDLQSEGTYVYPPPPSRTGPTRSPFPNMTSPDEPQMDLRNSFSPNTATAERPASDPVFQPAKFQHEDWAERLRQERNPSPTKQQKGSKSNAPKRPAVSTSNSGGDVMDIDPEFPVEKPRANGINLDEIKSAAPFASNGGLNGMSDDLKSHLPYESRAAAYPNLTNFSSAPRLKMSDLPRPPKSVHPPTDGCLDRQNWTDYIDGMKKYVQDWANYEERMIEHFRTRNRLVRKAMAGNWVSSASDGPAEIDETAITGDNLKAGYGTYMTWLADDKLCHVAWETACERHRGCMAELGRVREKIKGMPETDT